VFTFSWSSLRVSGRAAKRSCLPGLRRGGGRLAGTAVLSCLVWRCELTAGQVSCASEYVRRSHCAAGHTPTQTRHRTPMSDCRADSIHTATPDTTKPSSLCRVWRGGVNWTIAINTVGDSVQLSGIQFTPPKRTRHRQDRFVVSGVAV